MAKEYIPKNDLEQALIKEAAHLLRYYKRYMSVSDVVEELIGVVRRFSAADVAEVRRGRWEAWMPDKNGETREFICTGCRFMVEMSWKQKECDYEWCPYCGCKMDKEE